MRLRGPRLAALSTRSSRLIGFAASARLVSWRLIGKVLLRHTLALEFVHLLLVVRGFVAKLLILGIHQ
jgi:hypothetical protein